MSADSCWDVQAGIFTHLAATTALTSQLADGASSVLDHVPAGTAFPYVVLGEMTSQALDTHGGPGSEVTIAIHTYSRGNGMQQARSIMAAVYDALHDVDFTISNQSLVLCRCIGGETRLESDGVTRHGVQRFQIITEPEEA